MCRVESVNSGSDALVVDEATRAPGLLEHAEKAAAPTDVVEGEVELCHARVVEFEAVARGVVGEQPTLDDPLDLGLDAREVLSFDGIQGALPQVEHELDGRVGVAFALDPVVLLQPLVRGAEVSVGVWSGSAHGLQATGGSLVHLPDGETAFSYDHKYSGAGGWLEIPAAFPAPILRDLQAGALRVAEAVGVEGLARIDFFVTADGVVLNEINTMPGLRRESHFPRLVRAAGTEYDELLDSLVRRAARASGRAGGDRRTGRGIRTARTIGA